MDATELERLTSILRRDAALRRALRSQGDDPAAVMGWAREQGYSISHAQAAELTAAFDELSDDELAEAAGGEDPWAPKS